MFKNLFKAVVSIALLPVDAIKDVATMGVSSPKTKEAPS